VVFIGETAVPDLGADDETGASTSWVALTVEAARDAVPEAIAVEIGVAMTATDATARPTTTPAVRLDMT
jgi:hypothetical protein